MITLRRVLRPTIVLCALVLWSSSASLAETASAPVPANAGPNPKISTVGTLRVERYGSGSPAMIFIPGLACGSWVWDGAVKAYAAKHAVYVVTLAGFDGVPATASPSIDAADASLLQLLTTEKLDRPILVGHSLGGFLALRFGTEHAALLRAVVSVDGTPVFPTFAQMTPEQRNTAATGIGAQLASATPDQFAANEKQMVSAMVTAPADADRVAAYSSNSDPKAVAAYATDLFRADLRPQLPALTVPTLELAPVPTTPSAFEPPASPTTTMADREASYKAFYTTLFPGAPKLTVETIPNSRHFIMVDQPQALFAAIDGFVAGLPS